MSDSFPNSSKLRQLKCCTGSATAPCEILVDYDGVRYHFVLEYNSNFPESLENRYLQKVYDLYEMVDRDDFEDGDGVDGVQLLANAQFDCAEVFWPFVKERNDRIARASTSAREDADGGKVSVVRMQVKTVGGSLQAFEHDKLLKLRPDPIENPFSDLRIFQQTQVRRISNIAYEIFKVMVDGGEYCLKTVYATADEDIFLRELTILRSMPRHANVIPLCGVVATEDGRIEGFLTPYINGTSLRCVKSASAKQRILWKREITDAILWLHGRHFIWGDVKPHNIMINAITNHPVLVDFGGGATSGWVDLDLQGTREGDLQGLKRIVEFIDNIDG